MSGVWDFLKIDDLPNKELRWIARNIGMDVAIKVWRNFKGEHIACPAKIDREIVCRYMREHFTKTAHELAIDAGVNTRTIYRYKDYKPSRNPNQTSLF